MNTASIHAAAPRYFRLSWIASFLAAAVACGVFSAAYFSLSVLDSSCVTLLTAFALVCSALAYKLVQQRPELFLSPMPWLLLASGVYFGFGPLVYFFGADAAKEYCQDIWQVSTHDIFRVTFLNATGVALVSGVWLWRTRRLIRVKSQPFGQEAMIRAIVLFYTIGLLPRCITLLSNWGILHFIVPGFIQWLAHFTSAGLVLLTATAFRLGGGWWLWAGAMLGLDVATAGMTFSKMEVILSVVPCILGYMLYRPGVRGLRWVPVFLAVVYLASNSLVTYVRHQGPGANTMSRRLDLTKAYLRSGHRAEEDDAEVVQNWWTRLNYANVQTFTMKEYVEARPGHSFALALIAPVPRILWPGKPIIESGYGLYYKLTGQETASFGIGFFAEAYWNGGWLYVILSSIGIGWLLGTITLLISEEQALGNVWILPLALLWVKSGGRVDGWVHTEIVGPGVFTLLYIGALRIWLEGRYGGPENRSPRRPRDIPKARNELTGN